MGRESVAKAGEAHAPMKAFAFEGTRVTGVVAVVTMTGFCAPSGFRLPQDLLGRCSDSARLSARPSDPTAGLDGSVSRRKGRSQ